MAGKNPAFQFYPSDWSRDLEEHPLEIEGAWIRICCKLWWECPRGTSTKTLTKWARVMRVGEKKSKTIIEYLLKHNIADVLIQNEGITITSRRMVKDEYIRQIRISAGLKGGNPSLKTPPVTPVLDKQDLINQKPTPSSSSSSSTTKINKSPADAPFVLPLWIPGETWKSYLDVRLKKRASKTNNALNLIIKELEKIKREYGHDPIEVLNKSIRSGWTDVYPLKDTGGGNGRRPDSQGGSRIPEYTGETECISDQQRAENAARLKQLTGTIGAVPDKAPRRGT
jgi:hypothetical protein